MTIESPRASVRSPNIEGWPLAYLQYVEGQVAFGDTKAGLLLTADAILLTGLGLAAERSDLEGWPAALTTIAAFVLVAGITSVLVAIAPSRKHFPRIRWTSVRSGPPAGTWFQFGVVKERYPTKEKFVEAILSQSDDAIEKDLLGSIWGKCCWTAWKFAWLLAGVSLTILAVMIATLGGVLWLAS